MARSNAPVLIRGEWGTGKGCLAELIHQRSRRSQQAIVRVDCAGMPDEVIESQLFGYEPRLRPPEGQAREGAIERAVGGTLYLHEIGEISVATQAKLLRVLKEKEFVRIGGLRMIRADWRLLASTSIDLEKAVADGRFRADLYYRINVLPMILRPLRERPNDVLLLACELLAEWNHENGVNRVFHPSAFEVITKCNLRGNIVELENCVRRTAALAVGELITADEFTCNQGCCLSAMCRVGVRVELREGLIMSMSRRELL
ncbi:sigma 54-interacting transcriptional regulator [Bradyrhizobium sp. 83012]|uniref:Sigma 54-interacting transcriptional regulator n=1 Tax=Bradyrhizobium aeschynomenes TaxID=2734909 RepID=A0ABX2CQL1_9BRAD|nr:sigma 54-interacting transcriptional regulator [Bradyrhizobium aeschynomenes]NPU69710.1 sigma 54-interacting transcriptional regulator [Bradyrhizobium aeschynomenes]NPV24651.1 sigma 54-interacting transcriptional regulator [Bradyrhizobium aeschynomenes]